MMRLTIVHDSEGNIAGLTAYPADGPAVYLEAKPGEFVAQVDVPEITSELSAKETFERLSNLVNNYRVAVERQTKLNKKVESK